MSKINLLVTGLAISKGDHTPCNFDYSWIFNHPSTLLWADKIIITPYMDEVIESAIYPKKSPFSKSLKEIFDTAKNYDLIEVKDPNKILNSDLSDQVSNEIERDRNILPELYPDDIKVGVDLPGAICTNESEFCEPNLWSIYANLILSKKWNAQCLFSDHVMNFLQYKFGSSLISTNGMNSVSESFNTVFNPILPEYNFYSNMLGIKCGDCVHVKECEAKSLPMLRNDLSKYLDLRDYDELKQLKKIMVQVIKSVQSKNKSFDNEDIINEFKKEERSIRKTMHSTFPRVKRWANISLMASIPITMVGLYTGLPVVSAIGVGVAGVSKFTGKYVKHLESNNNWIGFKIDELK